MQGFDWNDLRFLLAAMRSGSLLGAARRLGVNESTVARRLARFESSLGTRLFERSPSGLHPTAAGSAVVAAAERVEHETQAIESQLTGTDSRAAGTVRLTSVPILANRVLIPALPSFLQQHPELQLELIAEPRDLSLTKREADIALRLARPRKEARNLARRIGDLDYAVYGPKQRDDSLLPWVTYEDSMIDLPQSHWIRDKAISAGEPLAQARVNDAEGVLACLLAGFGKSLLPVRVAEGEPGLRRLAGFPPGPSRELWLITHPDLRDLARIRVVLEWLGSLFEKQTHG